MSDDDVIRAFVCGDGDWEDLRLLGIDVEPDRPQVIVGEAANYPTVTPTLAEIAGGLLTHWRRGTGLREWARVVLGTGTVDLSALEDSPLGEPLLEALWDAAAGGEPTPHSLAVALNLEQF